jgi:UDP-glucose-4-epimerase GalE
MKATVLVVGGAGYIGSHMVKMLLASGCSVVTFDNLSMGHRDAVPGGAFVQGDLHSESDLHGVFAAHPVDLVMHFAGSCYVGESVQDPAKYYRNNVAGSLNLLGAMRHAGVGRLVFSSSCATYGDPVSSPMDEAHPQRPVNPYGRTKLLVEKALADYAPAYGLSSIALRYFNAAGADPEGMLGERHEPETHLIPLVLREALRVKRGGDLAASGLRIYGGDFETADGTCVRDYVHVNDLCRAHLLAGSRLLGLPHGSCEAYNLGVGRGYSVKEVIELCREITAIRFRYEVAARRPGDPASLVCNAERARRTLGWSPEYPALGEVVETAWRYYQKVA